MKLCLCPGRGKSCNRRTRASGEAKGCFSLHASFSLWLFQPWDSGRHSYREGRQHPHALASGKRVYLELSTGYIECLFCLLFGGQD